MTRLLTSIAVVIGAYLAFGLYQAIQVASARNEERQSYYEKSIDNIRTIRFVISAGGNDVDGGISCFVTGEEDEPQKH